MENRRLTEDQVREIWALLKKGQLVQEEIALLYGVTQETISYIATGARWSRITGLNKRLSSTLTLPPSKALRGRPRAVKLRTNGITDRAGIKYYKRLAKLAVNALLRDRKYVRVRVDKLLNVPVGFPRRRFESIDESGVVEIIQADLLLDWLHANTYSVFSAKEIARQKEIVSAQLRWVDNTLGLDEYDL